MDEGGLGLGAVLADLGANLVTVLLILLALSMVVNGHARQVAVQAYPGDVMPTLSGRAQSDLLFQRLRPSPDTVLIEVRRKGAVWIDAGQERLLREIPENMQGRAVIFVMSPAQYASIRDPALRLPEQRMEMTVPEALQGSEGDGFSDAFLSIRAGVDPSSIRPELKRLLIQGGFGRVAANVTGEEGRRGSGSFEWLATALRLVGNLTMLGLTLGLLRWLWRRTGPVL